MATASAILFVTGLLTVLPVSAGYPIRGQGGQQTVPDILVYVEDDHRVPTMVLLKAEATATWMFAQIGLQVQWAHLRPGAAAEVAGTGCAPKRPEQIEVLMVSRKTGSAGREAFASALPYARTGVRITVFYDELHEAISPRPGLETVVLAHVLVHEITHVLQGVVQHSGKGVLQAYWNARDYADMERRPLAFASVDVERIHDGLARTRSPVCMETASEVGARR